MRQSALLAAAAVAAAGAAVLGGFAQAASVKQTKAMSNACAGLLRPGLLTDGTVTSALAVAADAATGAPAYCEATAVITPVAGSKIGVVYRLPAGWNGKLLGLGGGGWAGNLRLEDALQGLKRGYATVQTDGGHPSTGPWDTAWAVNPESVTDFSHRAIHLMTVTGKEAVAAYYGKAQSKAYYQGCSTGGRMGLMEVQRYPADYDGVIAAAPVYNLLVQTSAVIRSNTFAAPGAGLSEAQLNLVNAAVLKACDAQDGVTDGVLNDPRACAFDPAELLCKAGQGGDQCLTPAQVGAMNTAYKGVSQINGRVAAWPLAKGGEAGWSLFIQTTGVGQDPTNGGGLGGLRAQITGDPDFDLSKFSPDNDLAKVRTSAFARQYEANDPAIGAFLGRGGKLLMWHGWSDPGPSPVATIAYYNQVAGSAPGAATGVRLFMAPGVAHCGGGAGPDRIDTLAALDQWVETGTAPDVLLATKASPAMSRPLCAYPAKAIYKGAGDPNDAASFTCG